MMDDNSRLLIRLGKVERAAAAPGDLFASINLSRFYFPGSGVAGSLLVHGLAVLGLFLAPLLETFLWPVPPPGEVVFIDLRTPETVMYLPPLGGSPREFTPAETVAQPDGKGPVSGPEGLSYPGLQPILSDVPDATNRIQTILQPEIENPQTLVPPLPMPNIVQTEHTPMVVQSPAAPAIEPEMIVPEIESIPPVRMDTSVLAHPRGIPPDGAIGLPGNFPDTPIPDLVRTGVEPQLELPEPGRAPLERLRRTARTLPAGNSPAPAVGPPGDFPDAPIPDLVRTGVEPQLELPEPGRAPLERLRRPPRTLPADNSPAPAEGPPGDFPDAPIPDLVRTGIEPQLELPEPGRAPLERLRRPPRTPAEGERFLSLTPMPAIPVMKIEIPEGEARGRFAISPEPLLDAPGPEPGIPETGTAGSGSASQAADAGANGPGLPARTVPGPGEDAFEGITILGGPDSTGDDYGVTVLGPGDSSSSGITIIGGEKSGMDPEYAPDAPTSRPLQTAYSLSIVSTENSGGGLPSYGVFRKDQIYTVYLDMRRSERDRDPSWILEFGLLDDPDESPVVSLDHEADTEGLILPFPAEKQRPDFPEDLIRRYLGGMIVVQGVINTVGRVEDLLVQDSPDGSLSRELLAALQSWVFRPARLQGSPVAVKVLFGIPLWLPDGRLE